MCFRCDEKWRIGHVCRRKELSVLIVGEEDELGENIEEENDDTTLIPMSISLNFVVESTTQNNEIGRKDHGSSVIVMIDLGATNNFISLNTVTTLNLPTELTKEFHVTLGMGEIRKGIGVCKEVEV